MPTASAPIVFVGALTWDAIALVDTFPERDERQVAREIAYAGGGPAGTAAVAARRLGVPAAVVGAVGDDDEGRRVIDSLIGEGVGVDAVEVVPGRRSGASVVVVDAAEGTRAICTRPVPSLHLPTHGPGPRLLDGAEWVHVDHVGWAPVQAWRAARPAAGGPRLSVDAGNPIAGFSCDAVDLYVPTLGALQRRYGAGETHQLLQAALDEGADTVVATCGRDGSVAATAAGARYDAPGCRVDVVSTLGAGDVFHGALLAAVVRGLDLPGALRIANTAAALSCRGLDGRSAIPTWDELIAVLDDVPATTATRTPTLETS